MGIGGPEQPATERDDNTTGAAVDPALAALVEAHARVMQGYARLL